MKMWKAINPALLIMLGATSSLAAENPNLTTGIPYVLSVPSVEYGGIPGFYQKGRIEYSPEGQTWKLAGYVAGVPIQQVNTVELVKTQDMPVQVFLKVSGAFPNGCLQVGEAGVSVTGNKFNVYLYYTDESIHPSAPRDCAAVVVPYVKVILLPVYGLPAGSYEYSLNGKFSGSFTLSADNILPNTKMVVFPPPVE